MALLKTVGLRRVSAAEDLDHAADGFIGHAVDF
jgi:hypothetical protein